MRSFRRLMQYAFHDKIMFLHTNLQMKGLIALMTLFQRTNLQDRINFLSDIDLKWNYFFQNSNFLIHEIVFSFFKWHFAVPTTNASVICWKGRIEYNKKKGGRKFIRVVSKPPSAYNTQFTSLRYPRLCKQTLRTSIRRYNYSGELSRMRVRMTPKTFWNILIHFRGWFLGLDARVTGDPGSKLFHFHNFVAWKFNLKAL